MGHRASVSTDRPPSALDVEDRGNRVDQLGRPKRLSQEAGRARVHGGRPLGREHAGAEHDEGWRRWSALTFGRDQAQSVAVRQADVGLQFDNPLCIAKAGEVASA
jgi:hypothetical protein